MTTFDKIVALMKGHVIINPDQAVTPASRFDEDLGMDSLDFIEMAMEIEEQFGLDVSDEQLGKIETVQQLVDAIEGRKVAA